MTQNELNGACGNNAQYSEVVKRPPEVGKCSLEKNHAMSLHHLALL